jgi:hypothetical protein
VFLGALLAASLPIAVFIAPSKVIAESAAEGAIERSAARISACRELATQRGEARVDILFVIDTSTSLRKSDPFGVAVRDPARVRAMEGVVSMLRSQTTSNKNSIEAPTRIRVNFLDFGSRVRPSFQGSDWQDIETFDSALLKNFGSKDDDADTDYVGALIDPGGVVDVLKRSVNESDCQVVLWFTDGKFEFDPDPKRTFGPRDFEWLRAETGNGRVSDTSSARRAREIGEELLCEKGESRGVSVADELRLIDRSGALTVIGVGLNTTTSRDNFSVLQRLLESPECGSEEPVGVLVEVASADDLADSMRRALFPVIPVNNACKPNTGQSGSAFYIAEPVERADIFVRSREMVNKIQLVRLGDGEDSTSIDLYSTGKVVSARDIEGVSVETTLLDNSPTLETRLTFTNPTESWVGNWELRACDDSGKEPAQLDADVVIRGCIAFDLAAGYDELVAGRTDGVYLILQRCGNDGSRLSTVSALSLEATTLIDGQRAQSTLQENESLLKVPFAPTVSSLAGAAKKKIKLQVVELKATYEVLAGSKPVVLEWSKDNSIFDIDLRLPPKTPYVEQLGCGSIAKPSLSVACEFRAVASDSVGRVYTEGPTIVPNASLGDVTFDAASSAKFPLEIRPGQPRTFTYTFVLTGTRKNVEAINQTFDINFEYETDGEPRESGVFSGEFLVKPDFGVTPNWGRAVGIALIGLLAALLILIFARWLTCRIQIPSDGMLWVGTIDAARCDSETVRSAVRSTAVDIAPLPLEATRLGRREISEISPIGDCGLTLKAKAGWRLFAELGYVSASNDEFHVIGADGIVGGPQFKMQMSSGQTSLGLVGEWWLVLRGNVDAVAATSEEVRDRLESLVGKIVFIASSAEPPRSFIDDLAFSVAGGVSAGLAALADRIHQEPEPGNEDAGQKELLGSTAPNI